MDMDGVESVGAAPSVSTSPTVTGSSMESKATTITSTTTTTPSPSPIIQHPSSPSSSSASSSTTLAPSTATSSHVHHNNITNKAPRTPSPQPPHSQQQQQQHHHGHNNNKQQQQQPQQQPRPNPPQGGGHQPLSILLASVQALVGRLGPLVSPSLHWTTYVATWQDRTASLMVCLGWCLLCLAPRFCLVYGPHALVLMYMGYHYAEKIKDKTGAPKARAPPRLPPIPRLVRFLTRIIANVHFYLDIVDYIVTRLSWEGPTEAASIQLFQTILLSYAAWIILNAMLPLGFIIMITGLVVIAWHSEVGEIVREVVYVEWAKARGKPLGTALVDVKNTSVNAIKERVANAVHGHGHGDKGGDSVNGSGAGTQVNGTSTTEATEGDVGKVHFGQFEATVTLDPYSNHHPTANTGGADHNNNNNNSETGKPKTVDLVESEQEAKVMAQREAAIQAEKEAIVAAEEAQEAAKIAAAAEEAARAAIAAQEVAASVLAAESAKVTTTTVAKEVEEKKNEKAGEVVAGENASEEAVNGSEKSVDTPDKQQKHDSTRSDGGEETSGSSPVDLANAAAARLQLRLAELARKRVNEAAVAKSAAAVAARRAVETAAIAERTSTDFSMAAQGRELSHDGLPKRVDPLLLLLSKTQMGNDPSGFQHPARTSSRVHSQMVGGGLPKTGDQPAMILPRVELPSNGLRHRRPTSDSGSSDSSALQKMDEALAMANKLDHPKRSQGSGNQTLTDFHAKSASASRRQYGALKLSDDEEEDEQESTNEQQVDTELIDEDMVEGVNEAERAEWRKKVLDQLGIPDEDEDDDGSLQYSRSRGNPWDDDLASFMLQASEAGEDEPVTAQDNESVLIYDDPEDIPDEMSQQFQQPASWQHQDRLRHIRRPRSIDSDFSIDRSNSQRRGVRPGLSLATNQAALAQAQGSMNRSVRSASPRQPNSVFQDIQPDFVMNPPSSVTQSASVAPSPFATRAERQAFLGGRAGSMTSSQEDGSNSGSGSQYQYYGGNNMGGGNASSVGNRSPGGPITYNPPSVSRRGSSLSGRSSLRGGNKKPLDVVLSFECYENQRWWVGLGWVAHLLPAERQPWTDFSGTRSTPRESFELLPFRAEQLLEWKKEVFLDPSRRYGWEWDGPWYVDLKGGALMGEVDEEGWAYADNFWKDWKNRKTLKRVVRHRRWIRHARLFELGPKQSVKFSPENSFAALTEATEVILDEE
ncbi:peroxisome- protein [Blyttiomyces sp. JEL0837]|nr:peroxisome- protein [Blyttiomyces sp. JEL0837]